jgi:hypothetical protein
MGALESDHIAYSPYAGGLDLLTARLEHDPRVKIRFREHGFNLLWRIVPGANDSFLLDWLVLPAREVEGSPPAPSAATVGLARYPRLRDERARALEGYVDTRRIDDGSQCITLAHPIASDAPAHWGVELAPWGPSSVFLNGAPVASLGGEPQAVIGRGVTFLLELAAGDNVLTVRTCPGHEAKGPRGFYLRRVS